MATKITSATGRIDPSKNTPVIATAIEDNSNLNDIIKDEHVPLRWGIISMDSAHVTLMGKAFPMAITIIAVVIKTGVKGNRNAKLTNNIVPISVKLMPNNTA